MSQSNKHLKHEIKEIYEKIVSIHESIPPIETTLDLDVFDREYDSSVSSVKTWVKKIRQIYYSNKNPKSRVIVGLFVEPETEPRSCDQKDDRHVLFQVFIGNHCMFYLVENKSLLLPGALSDLLLDSKTVVAAAKLKSLEEMLEKRFDLKLPRALDLNAEAAVSQGLPRDRFAKYGLVKLAKMLLRDEGDLDWDEVLRNLSGGDRTSVSWWVHHYVTLTDEKLRCGTFLAFLAYKMGVKFLQTN